MKTTCQKHHHQRKITFEAEIRITLRVTKLNKIQDNNFKNPVTQNVAWKP
jgi:hypothetical protein